MNTLRQPPPAPPGRPLRATYPRYPPVTWSANAQPVRPTVSIAQL